MVETRLDLTNSFICLLISTRLPIYPLSACACTHTHTHTHSHTHRQAHTETWQLMASSTPVELLGNLPARVEDVGERNGWDWLRKRVRGWVIQAQMVRSLVQDGLLCFCKTRFYWDTGTPIVYVLSVTTFFLLLLQWQSGVVNWNIWSTKLKILSRLVQESLQLFNVLHKN